MGFLGGLDIGAFAGPMSAWVQAKRMKEAERQAAEQQAWENQMKKNAYELEKQGFNWTKQYQGGAIANEQRRNQLMEQGMKMDYLSAVQKAQMEQEQNRQKIINEEIKAAKDDWRQLEIAKITAGMPSQQAHEEAYLEASAAHPGIFDNIQPAQGLSTEYSPDVQIALMNAQTQARGPGIQINRLAQEQTQYETTEQRYAREDAESKRRWEADNKFRLEEAQNKEEQQKMDNAFRDRNFTSNKDFRDKYYKLAQDNAIRETIQAMNKKDDAALNTQAKLASIRAAALLALNREIDIYEKLTKPTQADQQRYNTAISLYKSAVASSMGSIASMETLLDDIQSRLGIDVGATIQDYGQEEPPPFVESPYYNMGEESGSPGLPPEIAVPATGGGIK